MKLRALKTEDAARMLQWMHDESVVYCLATNFRDKTLADCEKFIVWANETDTDLHLAVADDNDEYMGTVSLKHISGGTAEFAITVHREAMGKGYAKFAMAAILEQGLETLDTIYWCVSRKNERAVRFYDKNGYTRTEDVPARILAAYTKEQREDFIWYAVTK